jgi:thiol-disulfide isomerase/thioredoxin
VSKGKRLAQERARQIVAAQRRADARRRRLAIAGGVVAAVVLVVAVLVGVKLATKKGTPAAAPTASPAAASVLSAVTGVPASVLDQVGVGKVDALPKTTSGQTVQTDSGKPLILYIGAEYCPYCAAERWAMVVALSRFGTFGNLGQTHSSSTDVYPNTATLSFHGATYTSQYVTFQGVETQTNQPNGSGGYTTLDTLTAQQQQIEKKYNAAPYVSADSAGSIPFISFANQAIVSGASYSPQLLAGKTADQIAAALSNPSDPIAQAVNGTANAFTALICKLTNNQPASVCRSTAVTAYQGKL